MGCRASIDQCPRISVAIWAGVALWGSRLVTAWIVTMMVLPVARSVRRRLICMA
jgi:hypothetical protein